jgi:agmatinase
MATEDLYLPQQSFAGLGAPHSDLQTAAAIILPVPFERTTEWVSGTREGPRAIIEASQYLELYDLELDRELHEVGIHTLAPLRPVISSTRDMVDRVLQATRPLVCNGKLVAMLGGEHSLSLGAVRAYKEKFSSLSVLQLDAHADLRNEYLGDRYGQACVMRRVSEVCPIVQVGTRSLSLEEKAFLDRNHMVPFYAGLGLSQEKLQERVLAALGQDVYITIDADVFDPSIMPAVGTPEPGGMTWQSALSLLRAVAQHRNVVGFDVMEFCPREGPSHCAYLLAKLTYKLIGYALA